tara:strand:- start:961 stop:1314 length:354 start_codon:yes stop_codon:yes gene_type:complete
MPRCLATNVLTERTSGWDHNFGLGDYFALTTKYPLPAISRLSCSGRSSLNLESTGLTPCPFGLTYHLEQLVDPFRRNLRWFFHLLFNDLGLNNRSALVVLRGAIFVAVDARESAPPA